MDSEKLISLVYENRCLWDMKNKQYHNRDISRKTWEKISKEMNANITAIKGRWRGLRDTFRKELSKLPKKRSGDEGGPTIKPAWPYYENLLFLKDQFASRTLNSNIPDVNSVGNSDTEENEDAIETVTQDTFEAEDHNSTQDICSIPDESQTPTDNVNLPNKGASENLQTSKRLKKTNSGAIDQLINIEKEKLAEFKRKVHQLSSHTNIDADYNFLISLLPYLRKVKEDRKMIVRMKLQQVFCDEDVLQQQRTSFGNIRPSSHASSYVSNSTWTTPSPQPSPNELNLPVYFESYDPSQQ
ncbi:hypothetical protein NQ317_017226 [Molorchus minor]|uniref:Transcription factor Adf-1 n=1 Tax=Molorchus minor TaxID=1323400 RepID=A0ABQ9JHJ6_9CUCU|nr:hypothetical protein NQ317_017226 [Molorchus minor]